MKALILSGAGRYADPWHPFAETSSRLKDVLEEAGFEVETTEDIDRRLEDLGDVDLLVVNAGDPSLSEAEPRALPAASAGLADHVARGGGILAAHTAAASLRDIPQWEDVLGGRWVRGVSMHPEFGRAQVAVSSGRHPIVAEFDDFAVDDERYSYLRVADDVTVLARHRHDGLDHPLLWTHERGPARVVYDALGHDGRSYDSPEHRELLRRSALWATGNRRPPVERAGA